MAFIPARKSFWGELLVFLMARRSIWRSFHTLYFHADEPLPAPPADLDMPVVFVSNHPSWWDGYIALMVMRQVYNLNPYLMMDERQLRRYIFFSWAGCFSVDQENGRSALRSIEYIANELQRAPGRACWIFPEGEITPQDAPLRFHSGTARTIKRIGRCIVYPVAFRLEFTREQYPTIFVRVGEGQRYGEVGDVSPQRSQRGIEGEKEGNNLPQRATKGHKGEEGDKKRGNEGTRSDGEGKKDVLGEEGKGEGQEKEGGDKKGGRGEKGGAVTKFDARAVTAELEAAVAAEMVRLRADIVAKRTTGYAPIVRGQASTDTRFDVITRFLSLVRRGRQ